MGKSDLMQFLETGRALSIASQGEDLWITTVFMGVDPADDTCSIYFISAEDAKHSQQILKNKNVAFATAWYNETDHTDRKGIQGQGICLKAETDAMIADGVRLHNQNYPEFKERITVEWVKSKDNQFQVWVAKPIYVKYWDDKLYGNGGTKEFTFPG